MFLPLCFVRVLQLWLVRVCHSFCLRFILKMINSNFFGILLVLGRLHQFDVCCIPWPYRSCQCSDWCRLWPQCQRIHCECKHRSILYFICSCEWSIIIVSYNNDIIKFLLFLQLSPLSIHGHYLLSCCVDCKDYLFLSFPPFSLSCFHYLPFSIIVITFIA